MLELPSDLSFLDETSNHIGLVAMRFKQDFHRQIATEIGIAALQHGPHPTPSNLTEEL